MKRRTVLVGAAAATLAGMIEPVHAIIPYAAPRRSVVSWVIEIEHQTDTLRVERQFSDGDFLIMWIPRSWVADNVELAESYKGHVYDIQRFFDAIDAADAAYRPRGLAIVAWPPPDVD
jgi:hypothetical protein